MIMFIHNVVKVLSFSRYKKQIKGRNSVAISRKLTLYDPNVDLVNDNVYTKFGLNPYIRFQEIEQKPNTDADQEPQLFCKFAKMTHHNPNIDPVNDNVYTKFGLPPSIRYQDIKQKPNSDVNQGP